MNNNVFNEEELLGEISIMLREASLFLSRDMTPASDAYNPTTTVDVAISDYVTEKLYALMQLPVISEENHTAFDLTKKGFAWVIDPLDGTLNALTKTIPYCMAVALVDLTGMETVLSCIFLPFSGDLYTAIRGGGAFLNGKKIIRDHVARKLVAYALPNDTMENVDQHVSQLKAVLQNGYITRQTGSTVHDVLITASGRYSGFYQFGLFLWDFVGADLIAHECGCVSWFRKSAKDSGGLRYDYIVASSASELEKLKALLCY